MLKYFKINRRKYTSNDPFTVQEGGFRYGKFKLGHKLDWTEQVFDSGGSGKEVVGKNVSLLKLPKISLVFLFFLIILLARTAWLQIVKNQYYYELAEGNRLRIERIEAKRGIIYDRNNRPLVRNVANFLLYFIPSDLPQQQDEQNKIINRVSVVLGDISSQEIKEVIAEVRPGSLESYQPLFIKDNIEYNKAMLLYLESAGMPGVILSNSSRREYLTDSTYLTAQRTAENLFGPDPPSDNIMAIVSLAHLLGYTGKISPAELEAFGQEYLPIDYIGKMGIEYFWENELKGINGKKQIEVDALGKEKKIISQTPASDGHNLVVSVDLGLQHQLEQIMLESLDRLSLTKGAAVIIDPNNGEILALVSLPAYDNNMFARGITAEEYQLIENDPDNQLFNRAVSGEYPSGSTIKPVIAAAALEEGIITERTSFNSVGGLTIGQWFFPDWRAGGHGVTDVRRAIAESVNTFFYYIGGGYQDFSGLGLDRIVHYGQLFGLGSQSGIDLAGEADGFLPTKKWKEQVKGESWYIGDTYHLAIGQGDILVTPLQVANYTSFFANGGKLIRPHLVRQILTGNDQLIKEIEPESIRTNIVRDYNIEIIRQGMRQAVVSGSAQRLQSAPVEVAGKTGTAQWSTKKNPHAWFTGFAPYDQPEIVVTILIEEGGEGSETAVPIAQKFLQWYFTEYKKTE